MAVDLRPPKSGNSATSAGTAWVVLAVNAPCAWHGTRDPDPDQLRYGDGSPRENRRTEAREFLRAAHESFGRIGAQAFAERARRAAVGDGHTAPEVGSAQRSSG